MGTPYDSDEDLLDSPEASSEQQSSTARRKLKSKSHSRKKLDDVFPMAKKGDGLLGSFNEPSRPIDIVVHEFETKPVDIDALRAGMVRFRFFLHASQPGSVPDPKILASMLDLVSLDYNYYHDRSYRLVRARSRILKVVGIMRKLIGKNVSPLYNILQ